MYTIIIYHSRTANVYFYTLQYRETTVHVLQ